jgi:hypothetical protein
MEARRRRGGESDGGASKPGVVRQKRRGVGKWDTITPAGSFGLEEPLLAAGAGSEDEGDDAVNPLNPNL